MKEDPHHIIEGADHLFTSNMEEGGSGAIGPKILYALINLNIPKIALRITTFYQFSRQVNSKDYSQMEF